MRIKFVSKTPADEIAALWQPLLDIADLPEGVSVTFDPNAQNYDFLIVYEDLPPLPGEKKVMRTETLACSRQNTLLITTEPSSIRIDGPNYLRQFGAVWTSRHEDLTPGIERPLWGPPLRYFYGRNVAGGTHRAIPKDIPHKSKDLSAMSSSKAMAHTMHAKRLDFILAVKDALGDELDLFGRGIRPVDDKAEAMDDYRFHIAIENHVEEGHITEKLTDCFVAGCLPFYFGDPDCTYHFPEEAVIKIDIFDLDGALKTIRQAIANREYEKRLPALKKARELALTRWNTVAEASHLARDRYEPWGKPGELIHGRHAFRRAHPLLAVQDVLFSLRMRRSHLASPLQR